MPEHGFSRAGTVETLDVTPRIGRAEPMQARVPSQNQKCLGLPDDDSRSEPKWKLAFTQRIGRRKAGRLLCLMPLICALTPGFPARSEEFYHLDQRSGRMEFSVTHLGVFTSHGLFRRFGATLRLDSTHPDRTSILCDADARSIEILGRIGSESYVHRLISMFKSIRMSGSKVSQSWPQGRDIILCRV